MAKIEITLTADYVQSWGIWEGIREIVQNARDGELGENAPMRVGLTPSGDKLQVENKGVTLSRDALLIGFSTKKESQKSLGQFGEGLKLGTLALCRLGYPVTIYNGDEIWTASIEQSEKFGREVLVFHTKKSKAANPAKKLTVQVSGITQDIWDQVRDRFLFLHQPEDVIETRRGKLILDETYAGRVYIKGVYVADENVRYGYDMPYAEIDRDRRMIRGFELRWEAANIWEEAMTQEKARRQELANKAFKLLENGSEDVLSLNFHVGGSPALDALCQEWRDEYGDNAYPVSNMAESRELSYLNANGVVCSAALRQVIERGTGTVEQVKRKLNEVNKVHLSWHELTQGEQDNLFQACSMVSDVIPEITLDKISVVEFPERPDTLGYFDGGTGMIVAARLALASLVKALHTVAHEAAHLMGGDGNADHTAAMGELLSQIAVNQIK